MISSTTPQWVAVYTRARAEKQVAERLEQQGFEAYLPIVEQRRIWSDRIKLVQLPLFPSYLFVKIINKQSELIRNIDGVCYLVRRNDILPIPDEQIDAVRRFLSAKQEVVVHDTRLLRKGAQAVITGGPFEHMQGTLITDCNEGNFSIRIEAIGLSLVTTIDRLLLKPLK